MEFQANQQFGTFCNAQTRLDGVLCLTTNLVRLTTKFCLLLRQVVREMDHTGRCVMGLLPAHFSRSLRNATSFVHVPLAPPRAILRRA